MHGYHQDIEFARIRTYRSQVKKFGYVDLLEFNIKSELEAASGPFPSWIHLVCHPAQSECILDTSSVRFGPSSALLYLNETRCLILSTSVPVSGIKNCTVDWSTRTKCSANKNKAICCHRSSEIPPRGPMYIK